MSSAKKIPSANSTEPAQIKFAHPQYALNFQDFVAVFDGKMATLFPQLERQIQDLAKGENTIDVRRELGQIRAEIAAERNGASATAELWFWPAWPESEQLRRPIEDLEIGVRSYNCLNDARIKTVGQLVRTTEKELLRTKNMGRKSVNEIKIVLENMGLRLGMSSKECGKVLSPESENSL